MAARRAARTRRRDAPHGAFDPDAARRGRRRPARGRGRHGLGTGGPGVVSRFREIEVEVKGELPPFALASVTRSLAAAGAVPGDQLPKLVRALGPRAVAPPELPQPGKVLASDPASELVAASLSHRHPAAAAGRYRRPSPRRGRSPPDAGGMPPDARRPENVPPAHRAAVGRILGPNSAGWGLPRRRPRSRGADANGCGAWSTTPYRPTTSRPSSGSTSSSPNVRKSRSGSAPTPWPASAT